MAVLLVDGELGADVDWNKVLVAEEVVDKIVNGSLVLVGEGEAVDWVKSSEIVIRIRITVPEV